MKARWPMVCECCKTPISTGARYVMHAGRPWRVEHLLRYQRHRRALMGVTK